MFSDAGRMINKVNISAWRKEGWREMWKNGSGREATCIFSFVSRSRENFKEAQMPGVVCFLSALALTLIH